MSSRALKKLHLKDELQKPDEEDEQEEVTETKKKNAFDLLSLDDEDAGTLPEENEEEEKENVSAQSTETKATTTSKKKKATKKKAKKKEVPTKENFDEVLDQFASNKSGKEEVSTPSIDVPKTKHIFSLEPQHLNNDNELRRIFGKKIIKEAMKNSSRRQVRHIKKMLLIQPKENWPKPIAGVSMEFVGAKNGINYFKMVFTPNYARLQEKFYQCVQTYNPNSFQLVLHEHPYHIDSLLQLSEVCKKTGEFETAMDLIERCIFYFESCWHPLFNPTLGNCQLSYEVEENKTFFLALFRYIQMLGREGSTRTAVEYCKLLLSLDTSDPLFTVFIIDHYCLRSEQWEYILQLYTCNELSAKNLSTLPNFCFAVAIAKFQLEQKMKDKLQTITLPVKGDSNDLLQYALMLFPMVLSPLLKKLTISFNEKDENGYSFDLSKHAYFVDTYCPPSLKHLVTLYVERNYPLWKPPEIVKWLKQNVISVIKKAEAKDPLVATCATILKEEYSDTTQNMYNHLLLSEYTDTIEALPREMVEALRMGGGPQLYQGFQQVQQPTIHANTRNPLSLFLQTLFNPVVPNAPMEGGENNGEGAWFNNLINLLIQQDELDDQNP